MCKRARLSLVKKSQGTDTEQFVCPGNCKKCPSNNVPVADKKELEATPEPAETLGDKDNL